MWQKYAVLRKTKFRKMKIHILFAIENRAQKYLLNSKKSQNNYFIVMIDLHKLKVFN